MAMEIAITVMEDEELQLNNNNENLKNVDRKLILNKVLTTHHQDNFNLLSQIKHRLHRAGVEIDKVQVRFENLKIGADVQVGSRSLPTLINFGYDVIEVVQYVIIMQNVVTTLGIMKSKRYPLTILKNVSGMIKPGRYEITYSHTHFKYIKQLDYLEKEMNIQPNPDIDAFMKAASIGGKEESILSDYVLKILGLDVCSEVIVGDHMVRGISGGQRKRVTTALRKVQTIIPLEDANFAEANGSEEDSKTPSVAARKKEKGMILPFKPLTMTFHNVSYFVDTPKEFVEEVMSLVELDTLRHALVGIPGSTGLSTEQRKRLTIAVELVANPSIIFMDEPTSGLDARAAAIVMRAVRNTVDTGRTVVCTIHQPSIDIFEAFDELILMKRGGKVIYGGKLGTHSQSMIDYFEGISGVTQIPKSYNPATWMLENWEDFADIYKNSEQYKDVEASIKHYSVPAEGEEPLKFESTYSQDKLSQFMSCLWKQRTMYWRSPHYNAMRLVFTLIGALIFGSVFWNIGMQRNSTQEVFVVIGALYTACLFLGVNNASSVQPIVSIERTVFYRERAAGMYSPIVYALAQGLMEIPYIGAQTIIFGVTTYLMVNFERSLGKFLLYILFMFLTFTYFTFYGMMAVGLTPTQHMAAIVSSAFYSLWNLFNGFLVPKTSIPRWWIWFYYACPVSWTLRGIISSQLGDVETMIEGPGFEGTVKQYLEVSLGYGDGMIGVSVAVLFAFIFLFFSVFATSLKLINFQKR
ncbi:hypothetical protein Csa_015044 [Cucumis sativus]|nr:hypothetical protein Csa_015044 [Cucumis sativus]